MAIYKAID